MAKKKKPTQLEKDIEQGLWGGWGDFLGTGQTTLQKKKILEALEKKKKEILRDLLENEKMYARWPDGLITLWFESEGLFKVKDPFIRSFFKNYVDLRKTVEGRRAIMFWLKTHKFSKAYGIYMLGQAGGSILNPSATRVASYSGSRKRSLKHLLEEEKIDAKTVLKEIRHATDFKDPEVRKLHVQFTNQLIWKASFEKEKREYKWVKKEKLNGNRFHDDVVKTWKKEYRLVKATKLPKDFNKKIKPTLMQMYNAWKMTTVNGFFNLSRTGVGKTLAAILSAVNTNSKNVLVIAPNNIVKEDKLGESQWKKQILQAFPNSLVSIGKVPHKPIRNVRNFHLINYDKFSQKDTSTVINNLVKNHFDFIVIDETQNIKIRNEEIISLRRIAVDLMLKKIRRTNPKIKVLCITATPLMNNVKEAKTLLQIVTGDKMPEIADQSTIRSASQIHAKYLPHSIRFLEDYGIDEQGRNSPIDCDAVLPPNMTEKDIDKMTWLQFEQIAMEAKIPEILKRVKGKTIIYTEYVTGITSLLQSVLEKKGYKVGVFTGANSQTRESEKQDFINGSTQVLIASSAIAEGVDELQLVCSNLIFASLPWTHARFEQVIGRIVRKKQRNKRVTLHVLLAKINGFPYDLKIKLNRLEFKYQMSRCVTEGTLPEKLKLPRSRLRKELIKAMVLKGKSTIPTRKIAQTIRGRSAVDV